MGIGQRLAGCRVLVVEDDWFLSRDLDSLLRRHGAVVVGPVATLGEALDFAKRDGFEIAVIDIKLMDEPAYPMADELRRQGVPFAFATGYPASELPGRFSGVPVFEKPFEHDTIVTQAERLCCLRRP